MNVAALLFPTFIRIIAIAPPKMSRFSVSFYLATILTRTVVAQIDQFQPCPILGPYVPTPRIDALSEVLQSALKDFTDLIDGYVAEADGLFGPITPNTTSFSMAIFAGEGYVPKEGDETPYFFEYHHTAGLLDDGSLTSNSAFALGDVTQMFTVLTTLTEWGSKAWQKSIVEFVPELLASSGIAGSIEHVNWREVTVGALTSHMAGIARDCKTSTSAPGQYTTANHVSGCLSDLPRL